MSQEERERERLIQVEPRGREVLLALQDISGWARGGSCAQPRFDITALTPEDAIALANQLASAAELILDLERKIRDVSCATISQATLGKPPGIA